MTDAPIKLTRITSQRGLLTKKVFLNDDGEPVKKAAANLTRGTAERCMIESGFEGLLALKNSLEPNQAIIHGTYNDERPPRVRVVTAGQLNGAADAIARTKAEFQFGRTTLIDYDYDPRMGAPLDREGLLDALCKCFSGFEDAGWLWFPSTSAGIYNGDTQVFDSHGQRFWFIVEDPGDIPRFFEVLKTRALLEGYGWVHISADGSRQVRVLFDDAVYSPERLDFAAGAHVAEPLWCAAEEPLVHDGNVLDTHALPNCTEEQLTRAQAMIRELLDAAAEEAGEVRNTYNEEQVERLVAQGVERARAVVAVETRHEKRLEADDMLHFDHLPAPVPVAEVLLNMPDFDGKSLRDPLEPDIRGKAKFWMNRNGVPCIHSFLHGGRIFTLPYNNAEIERNGNGVAYRSVHNLRVWIRDLGLECKYNAFKDRLEIGGVVVKEYAGELSDRAEVLVAAAVADHTKQTERTRFEFPLTKVHEAIIAEALLNTYNPVTDYLDGLHWDGVRRLDAWATKYLGAPDTELNRAIGRLLLIAACKRAREPGCKYDYVVVLEGPQGNLKSTAIETLAGGADYFSDQDLLAHSSREQAEQLQGVWFYEIAEMTGRSKADVNKTKAFCSRRIDRVRLAYARNRTDTPRGCVFVATSNDAQYLTDKTGNRRWLPLPTTVIDIPGLREARDQLFAEADAYARTEALMLPESLWAKAAEVQKSRVEDDPWRDRIEAKLDDNVQRVASSYLMGWRVLNIPTERQSPHMAARLRAVMEDLGWTHDRNIAWLNGYARGYWKGEDREVKNCGIGPADETDLRESYEDESSSGK